MEPESKRTRRGRRAKDLATLIQTTINDDLSNDFVATRRVTRDEAKIIASLTGKNTDGWFHVIDGSAIRHIMDTHGTDTLPMTHADIARIPQITETADDITYEGKDHQGLYVVRYEKNEGAANFVYVVETVRQKRGKLAVTTAYKDAKSKRTGVTPAKPASQGGLDQNARNVPESTSVIDDTQWLPDVPFCHQTRRQSSVIASRFQFFILLRFPLKQPIYR